MVELVIERRGFTWAFAIEHGQRSEGARFIDVTAVAAFGAFSDQALALPQEFSGVAVDGFFYTSTEGIVLVGCGAATRQANADQAVLAVVTILGDEFLSCATALANQIAVGVVVVMAVTLHQQAVTFDVGEVCCAFIALAQ